jgi:uncharacterized protein YndB with AHSA1/START domain
MSEAENRDLVLRRRIAAPPAAVWRAWRAPALLVRWFAPALWTTRLHWSVTDRERHEQMGFHQGWSRCADQLEKVAAAL